jgi:hypothetical protein
MFCMLLKNNKKKALKKIGKLLISMKFSYIMVIKYIKWEMEKSSFKLHRIEIRN